MYVCIYIYCVCIYKVYNVYIYIYMLWPPNNPFIGTYFAAKVYTAWAWVHGSFGMVHE